MHYENDLFFLLAVYRNIRVAQSVSTVTVNVRGNINEAIVIDNTEYVVYNDYPQTPIPYCCSNLQLVNILYK
jgi:hypothetical protein